MEINLYSANETSGGGGGDRKRINIMTSSDNNLIEPMFIQLKTISCHLKDKDVHFYLFYNRIFVQDIKRLEEYCDFLGNITFHEVFIADVRPYHELAIYGGHSPTMKKENINYRIGTPLEWPAECCFAICCQEYLPEDVDRVLYIDSGDILFTDSIDEYYFDDFEDNIYIITPRKFKQDWSYFTYKDLEDEQLKRTIMMGIFNGGSYMINVDGLRCEGIVINEFVENARKLPDLFGLQRKYSCIDEGIITYHYLEKIKYFGFETQREPWYRPYNHTMDFYIEMFNDKRNLWYKPIVIHFVTSVKPTKLKELFPQIAKLKGKERITIRELLEFASRIKRRDMNIPETHYEGQPLIEKGSVPLYEYWFKVEYEVMQDFAKIEKIKNGNASWNN